MSADERVSEGGAEDYHLRAGYRRRLVVPNFDDMANKDEWQDHVYAFARAAADRFGLRSVLDIGCGSGFKLVKYFAEFDCVGVDRAPCVAELRKRYPDRRWLAVEAVATGYPPADLYICSDVIEHFTAPEILLEALARASFRKLVLSTPAREVLVADGLREPDGPPGNEHHAMEWTMGEFHRLVSAYFDVEEHLFAYNGEHTQYLLCAPKAKAAAPGDDG